MSKPCSTASSPASTPSIPRPRSPPNRQPPRRPGRVPRLLPDASSGRAFAARFVLVAVGSVADAMLPIFVGWIVGMLATTPLGAALASTTAPRCCSMLAVVLLRPLLFAADALVRNHAIVPNLVDLVRWQSHWHVIRQSWSFFQNDFAGRIGTKVMQAGDAIEMSVEPHDRRGLVRRGLRASSPSSCSPAWTRCCWCPIALWLVAYGALFRWRCRGSPASPRSSRRPTR